MKFNLIYFFLKSIIKSYPRNELHKLWDECFYTPEQRNRFSPLHSIDFTEELLEEHEAEAARVRLPVIVIMIIFLTIMIIIIINIVIIVFIAVFR